MLQITQGYDKFTQLPRLLEQVGRGNKVLIFANSKKMCDQLSSRLHSYGATAIHGDKKQQVG